jgi:hypothetical protein
MKIVGTQLSNRRRDKRVSVMPIEIELEGKVYTAIDWSLGGFLIEGYAGRRRPGDEVTIGIQVIASGVEFNHVAQAEVVRIDPHGKQLAANFVGLDSATLGDLEGWLTGRLRRRQKRKKAG